MNWKKQICIAAMIGCTLLSGCSQVDGVRDKIGEIIGKDSSGEEKDYNQKIKGEQSTLGVKETELSNDTFYVHSKADGLYYPIYSNHYSFDEEDDSSDSLWRSNPKRMAFFDTSNEENIPTLYLGKGDSLIYYKDTGILDHITWERFKDCGYTIGAYAFETTSGGKVYLPLQDTSDLSNILVEDTKLYDRISEIASSTSEDDILFAKIGGENLLADQVSDNIITGFTPNQTCDIEAYVGTNYYPIQTVASTHAFSSYEVFKSTEYQPLQIENMFEIEIPEYFVDGYYNINDLGFFRLVVSDDSYVLTDKEFFNTPLLFPESENEYPKVYSACEELNQYSTNVEGALGYIAPETTEMETETVEAPEDTEETIPESTAKYYQVSLTEQPGDIAIQSDTGEMSGYITLYKNKSQAVAAYDGERGEYVLSLDESDIDLDSQYILCIAGLYDTYQITVPDGWTLEEVDSSIIDTDVKKASTTRRRR